MPTSSTSASGPCSQATNHCLDAYLGALRARHPPQSQDQVALEGDTIDLASATLHDDVTAFDQTGAVVEETLRLYPSGISIVRVANQATEITGHRVRKGTLKPRQHHTARIG